MCSFPACERDSYAHKLCKSHYAQRKRGKPLTKLRPRKPNGTWLGVTTCLVEGCSGKHRSGGFCTSHLWQVQKSKNPTPRLVRRVTPGEWGRWARTKGGYVVRYRSLGRVDGRTIAERQFQHRVVMEEKIGRPLRSEETVHHRNGVRDQNNIENLELWSTSQPSGQRVVDKVAWAKELLALYEPESIVA